MLKMTKICVQKYLILVKFQKCAKNSIKSANFCLLLFYIVQREDMLMQIDLQLKVEIEDGCPALWF